jgi:hypothetical protein
MWGYYLRVLGFSGEVECEKGSMEVECCLTDSKKLQNKFCGSVE